MAPLRTRLTGLVAAAGLLAGTLAGSSAGPAAAATAGPRDDAAAAGSGYLGRQILANGGYVTAFGSPDVPTTAYAVLGLAATGTGRTAAGSAIRWLKSDLDGGLKGSDGQDDPGRIAHVVLAAVATGSHPRRFGGNRPVNDLVTRLLATMRASGPDRGLFGMADPTFDGAYRQGLALAALKAAGVRSGLVSPALGWLQRQQCANGLWTAYRSDLSAPCPAADPNTFTGPDTNSTSLAVQGLAAYNSHPRTERLLASLDAVQASDAGFPYLAAKGLGSDPNSTALVIQAILAAGAAVRSDRFTAGGRTAYQALAGYQLGCADPVTDRGAFFYPGLRAANTFATVQAVPALAARTLPLPRSDMSDALPEVACRTASGAGASGATVAGSTTAEATAAGATAAARGTAAGATAEGRAGTAGACAGTSGVTVAVDLTALGGSVQVRCAPGNPATGIAALQQAGFAVAGTQRYGLAFVCRINNRPRPAQEACVSTPPPSAYWSYWHAGRTATKWGYSSQGAQTYDPAPGTIEGWAFGAGGKPAKSPKQVRNS